VSLDNDGPHAADHGVAGPGPRAKLFLMDLKKGTPTDTDHYWQEFSIQRVGLQTEGCTSLRMRMLRATTCFVTEAGNYEREDWKEIIPQTGSVLQGAGVLGRKDFRAVRAERDPRSLRFFDLQGTKLKDLALPAIGTVFGSSGKWDRDEMFYGFQSFYVLLRPFTVTTWRRARPNSGPKVEAPSIDPRGL